jgi:peptidoglycan/LPS O-acetylase OafA/YrhL
LYLGHLWSLCVEEQFYLLWPWVVFRVRNRRKLVGICAAAVVLGPLLRLLLQAEAPGWMLQGELLYRFTPAQMDALLLGGLVALLWRGAARARVQMAARVGAGLGTVVVAAYLVFVVHGWRMSPPQYPHWLFTGGLLFADMYSAAVMVCALRPGSWTYTLLNRKALRWTGRLSYGAYIFHDLLHGLFVHAVVHGGGDRFAMPSVQRDAATAALALPVTLLLAWLSFRFFESPFLNLKERWTRTSA